MSLQRKPELIAVSLDEKTIAQLRNVPFDCGDTDLNGFLRDDAYPLQQQGLAFCYVAVSDGDIVGYIALACDAIPLDGDEKKTIKTDKSRIPRTVPCLKVGRLAAVKSLQKNGIGKFLMSIAYDKAVKLSSMAGCRFLSVDAYPAAEPFYISLGFVHNQVVKKQRTDFRNSKKGKDQPPPNISMRLDIFSLDLPQWHIARNMNKSATIVVADPGDGSSAPDAERPSGR